MMNYGGMRMTDENFMFKSLRLAWIIIIIKALFKTERPISEVREEDAGINR